VRRRLCSDTPGKNGRKPKPLPMGLDFRWGETFTDWNRDDAQQELDYRLEMNQIKVRTFPGPDEQYGDAVRVCLRVRACVRACVC